MDTSWQGGEGWLPWQPGKSGMGGGDHRCQSEQIDRSQSSCLFIVIIGNTHTVLLLRWFGVIAVKVLCVLPSGSVGHRSDLVQHQNKSDHWHTSCLLFIFFYHQTDIFFFTVHDDSNQRAGIKWNKGLNIQIRRKNRKSFAGLIPGRSTSKPWRQKQRDTFIQTGRTEVRLICIKACQRSSILTADWSNGDRKLIGWGSGPSLLSGTVLKRKTGSKECFFSKKTN